METAKTLIDKLAEPAEYQIHGAILGCLGKNKDKIEYEIVEELPDDPWQAIIKSKGLLTKKQLQEWHKLHNVDVDQKGVPYYFIVDHTPTGDKFVWYSDDSTMLPINTKEDKQAAIKRGLNKGLIEEQLDF